MDKTRHKKRKETKQIDPETYMYRVLDSIHDRLEPVDDYSDNDEGSYRIRPDREEKVLGERELAIRLLQAIWAIKEKSESEDGDSKSWKTNFDALMKLALAKLPITHKKLNKKDAQSIPNFEDK